jgi:serine/threonine protein phosphatase PrpC
MSADLGDKIYALSEDHKPSNDNEIKRIIENGGKIYQTKTTYSTNKNQKSKRSIDLPPQVTLGPPRVKPGRLSVSRTFGDIEAKVPKYGGKRNVVIAIPEITEFSIENYYDFILLGSDGIFDKIPNEKLVKRAWTSVKLGK